MGKTGRYKNRKRLLNLVRRTLLALVGVAIGANAYLANARGILGDRLPMPFGYGAAVVLSGSMEPAFSRGDLLFVRKQEEIQEGDVVVYQSGAELVVHRVMELNGEMVVTRGDANNATDEPFPRENVKGVVIGRIPFVGRLVQAIKTPGGILVLLAGAFFLVELSFRKEKDRDSEKLEAIKEEIRRLKAEKEEERQRKSNDIGSRPGDGAAPEE